MSSLAKPEIVAVVSPASNSKAWDAEATARARALVERSRACLTLGRAFMGHLPSAGSPLGGRVSKPVESCYPVAGGEPMARSHKKLDANQESEKLQCWEKKTSNSCCALN